MPLVAGGGKDDRGGGKGWFQKYQLQILLMKPASKPNLNVIECPMLQTKQYLS
jgi:hypothetical protein